jgi:methyl-accepting chemotaxis protein
MVLPMLRSAKIGTKLSLATFLAVGGLFGTFVIVTGVIGETKAQHEAVREVTEKSALLNNSVAVLDHGLRDQVGFYTNILKSRLPGQFALVPDSDIDVGGKPTPTLLSDDTQINLNTSIPDRFTELTGAYATFYVRKGNEFIRVASSHKEENGQRAIGTELDHAHPAYAAMLKGQTYVGAAPVAGSYYMTRYDPIKSSSGETIGIMYVGVNFTGAVKSLGDGIKALKLGDNGGFYALNARPGPDLGKALIHAQREGSIMLGDKDADGKTYVQKMLDDKNGVIEYLEGGHKHIAAFTTNPEWEMLIVGDAYLDEVTAPARSQRNMFALIGLLMVGAVTGLLYFIIRRTVAQPIGRALTAVQTVANGDLTHRVEVESDDESGRLMASMQEMMNRLSKVVLEVREGTAAITSDSRQVASGNMELSERTEQQGAALEKTATSMEQMNTAVRQNAEHARQAQLMARDASATAHRGGEAVGEVVQKMGAISQSAARIADIISVIDGIAFQTNILALNAAVEAARAGEQGRGFAVVASEVRTLAQRTTSAAKEVKILIQESLQHAQAGTKLADRAGGTMAEVVKAIVTVNVPIDEITGATSEQSSGLDEINRAIVQLDQMTQQNAALVEEAAAAAQNMNNRAEHLAEVVRFFVVDSSAAQDRVAGPTSRSRKAEPALGWDN